MQVSDTPMNRSFICVYVSSLVLFSFSVFVLNSSGKFTVGDLQTDHDDENDCKMCVDGQFWDRTASECTDCAAGKKSSNVDKFGCEDCGVGKFSSR